MSKRYLKYLAKKYLKRNCMRKFLYIVAERKNSYILKYVNCGKDKKYYNSEFYNGKIKRRQNNVNVDSGQLNWIDWRDIN